PACDHAGVFETRRRERRKQQYRLLDMYDAPFGAREGSRKVSHLLDGPLPVMKESATRGRSSKNAPQHDHAAMLAGKPTDSSVTSSPSHEFVVPVERQQQIGVTFATVEMKPLSHSIRAVGRVVPETQRVWRVTSRTPAYVQELGVNAPGELVK